MFSAGGKGELLSSSHHLALGMRKREREEEGGEVLGNHCRSFCRIKRCVCVGFKIERKGGSVVLALQLAPRPSDGHRLAARTRSDVAVRLSDVLPAGSFLFFVCLF